MVVMTIFYIQLADRRPFYTSSSWSEGNMRLFFFYIFVISSSITFYKCYTDEAVGRYLWHRWVEQHKEDASAIQTHSYTTLFYGLSTYIHKYALPLWLMLRFVRGWVSRPRMWTWGGRDRTTDRRIGARSILPPEPQAPCDRANTECLVKEWETKGIFPKMCQDEHSQILLL